MNAKNLHKHSLPVLGILVVAFVLSISLTNRSATTNPQGVLAKALVARLIKVEPTANGLARIQINHQGVALMTPTTVDSAATSELQAVGASSGELVRLSFVVEALNTTQPTIRK